MGRFVCNTYEEATTNPDFDVIVIGGGMYGAYCAAKIYRESEVAGRTPLRVLVLEAGPFLIHEHGQNIPDLGLSNPFRSAAGVDQPEPRHLVWGTGWVSNVDFPGTAYCVGGKSLYWGGWCPRLRDPDLNQWPQEVRSYLTSPPAFGSHLLNRVPGNLDLSASTVTQPSSVYESVEFEIGVKPADDFVFDPLFGPSQPANDIGLNAALKARMEAALTALRAGNGTPLDNPEPPPIAVQTQSFVSGVFSPDKFSSLPLLISARRSASGQPDAQARLFVVPNAHVAHLLVAGVVRDGAQRDGYRVSAIELFVNGVRQFLTVKPSYTVVLGLGCIESTRLALESFPTGPQRPNNDEIMGRNLKAHLRFDFQFALNRQAFSQWVSDNTNQTFSNRLQTASFHLQADSAAGRFHLQVYAAGDVGNNPEGLLYRMIPDADVAQRLADAQDPTNIDVVFRACGELRADRNTPIQTPGTSWIDLAGPTDRDLQFDHARAFVNYADQTNAQMWSIMRSACIALANEMGAVSIPPEDRHQIGTTWHDSGTLFMGDDPANSVTDTSGHFHHIANAACVDQALFPTVGSANPVLTGLCLSRKVAETIVDRYVSEPALTAQQIVTEQAAGFQFLLEPATRTNWKPNNPRFTATRPALVENDTILEVHGDAGLGVLFYDDNNLFGDFELRLQWKAFSEPGSGDITANSGIFLRTPRPPNELNDENFYDRSIEIQIDDTGYDFPNRRFRSPLHRTGAVYSFAPARLRAQKAPSAEGTVGLWNDYQITAQGSRVTVRLNGRLVSEGDVPLRLTAPGFIGLQYHTGKVQFRMIRIRRMQ